MTSDSDTSSELRIRLVARKNLDYFPLRDLMAWLGCTQCIPRPRSLVSELQSISLPNTDAMRKHVQWLDRVEQFLTPQEQRQLCQLLEQQT